MVQFLKQNLCNTCESTKTIRGYEPPNDYEEGKKMDWVLIVIAFLGTFILGVGIGIVLGYKDGYLDGYHKRWEPNHEKKS